MSSQGETFWGILKRFEVVIPVIQRDYVQGRRVPAVENARNLLLDDLRRALDENIIINLNFVYGKANGEVFHPLDGQQRLTTLFLLHWFALRMNSHASASDYSILSKFTYQTRKSSRDFFRRLTDAARAEEVEVNGGGLISASLWDKYWFRPEWLNDPTIKSSLVVLDLIQEKFADLDDLWGKLIDEKECPIRFEWLNVEGIGNEDELYIKMNARGKLLSSFENFKAELEKASEDVLSPDERRSFFLKLDQGWTDFFWSHAGVDYDKCLMGFFNWVLWNRWSVCNSYTPDDSGRSDGVLDMQGTIGHPIGGYETGLPKGVLFDAGLFAAIGYLLDYVSGPDADEEIKRIVLNCSSGDASYYDRMMLQSALSYFAGKSGVYDSSSWSEWDRIISNLSAFARDYQGYNTLGRYSGGIKCIDGLQGHANNLVSAFADDSVSIEGFMPAEQIEEERIKAKLILSSNKWHAAILEAERIKYFKGKIGFLLSFAGAAGLKEVAIEGINYDKFHAYTKKVGEIFADSSLRCDENLLRRALLTKGDYSLPHKSIRSYIVTQSHRDMDWRGFFRMFNEEHRRANRKFKELLDDLIERGSLGIDETLRGIIDDYEWDSSRADFWAQYFIEIPSAFDELGDLRQFKPIQVSEADQICLLPRNRNTKTNGKNKEAKSSAAVCLLRERYSELEVEPLTVRGIGDGEYCKIAFNGRILTLESSLAQPRKLRVVEVSEDDGAPVVLYRSGSPWKIAKFVGNILLG